jgi:N-glycosylase/DNA lyase
VPDPPGRRRARRAVLRIPVPGFDLDLVARSHGWYDLAPFRYDEAERELSFVAQADGRPFTVTVRSRDGELTAAASRGTPAAAVRAAVRRVLDLDADLGPFHALCRMAKGDGFSWIARRGGGRILRSPSLFEDAVKVLATTNCSWSLTRLIVTDLIAVAGAGGAFPTAAEVAALPESRLRKEARLGYRAPFLAAFADRVASGKTDLSRWEEPGRPDDEVEQEIRSEAGFGPYAAASIGRLLGRHAKLGLDSWSRKKVAAIRFGGRKVSDSRVERLYGRFGKWAGLAFWLDVTRDWHERRERLWP